MADERTCPHCGKPVPPTALGGICPECMLKAGLATQTEGLGTTGPHGTKVVFPPPSPAKIASLFPQLEILECLGRGGMGVVYKARQPRLNRLVALKILARERQLDVQFAERFTREAQALARLNHPNIVTVHDFGEAGGHCYLVMEFVDGLNLRQLLQTGKMPPGQALTIVPKICEALQYAHNEGIVHRDIKPENILLDKSGRVKIADFGIAKMVGIETGQQTLTGAKDAVGTPHYMAPEQIEKPLTVDHRADIYSLGVVFYEMLTGELPLGKFQPPSKKVQIDVRLDEVVLHALEKEPERRYQQASQVKTAVETIASSSGRESAPSEEQSRLTPAAENRKSRFSRTAILGACLGTSFILSGLPMMFWLYPTLIQSGQSVSKAMFPAVLMVLLGFCSMTIHGWIAVSQIRHSVGRLYGMGLAVFEGLLFPLLALDALIVFFSLQVARTISYSLLANFYPELRDSLFLNVPHFMIWLLLTLALMGWVNFGIRLRVWRAVNKPLSGLPTPSAVPPADSRHSDASWKITTIVAAIILMTFILSGLIANHFHPIKSDYIGQVWFPQGDSIEIMTAGRTQDRMVVKGHYNLVSHDGAILALYVTSTNQDYPENSKQRMLIAKGQGDFELIDSYLVPGGLPHISMYADGGSLAELLIKTKAGNMPNRLVRPFATLYFGTKAEALEESQANWIAKTNQTAENASQLAKEGWQLWQARKLNEAAAKFNQAVGLTPGDANAWNGLGWATFNSGKTAEAEKAFQKAVLLDTNQPGALNGLGQIYLSQRKYDQAETYLLKAAPQAPAAWYGLTRLYLLERKFDLAQKWAQDLVDSGQADDLVRQMLQAAQTKHLSEGLQFRIEPPLPPMSAEDMGQTVAGLPPVVVETFPVSGARDVQPGITEIRVRFSKPMADGSWSWSTAWVSSTPESIGAPHYLDDQCTCVLKVRLEPGRTYAWWLNSEKFHNFTDSAGRPAVPYLLIFQTKQN